MNWANYLLMIPKTLEERRMEQSAQYRKERRNEYQRKTRARKKVVQQLLAGSTS